MNKTSIRKWNLKSSDYTFFLRYMVKYTPMFVVYICMIGIVSALATFIETVYSLKYITDCIQYDKPFRNIIIFIICILLFIFLKVILEDLFGQYFFLTQSEKLKLHIRMDLYKKVIE
ncbi:hypothetical protein H0486_11695 [Lachnospiraceae bacterium MD1]|uniref:ABC transmembrane type-1 domain-containing protein n=1 Tax=Variimorphobacter saccharofermentans TaxID=2755051 RepID=A0A839K2C7_9FIRM|nr:hypothetical protein [Variimorphobacter saccharofermentans]MBB2183537.1 hypothetical protein [Variimorphobacter saccharofermentans]